MNKRKVGIVGAGAIAHFHAWAVAQLSERAELAGVYDVNTETAQQFGAKYGCKAYGSVEEMADSDVEAAGVCTPPMSHHEMALPFVTRGKHVMVEKPFTAYTWQGLQVLAAAKVSGAKVMTCCQREFLPPVQRVLKAVAEGKIGPFVSCHARINGHRDDVYYNGGKSWKGQVATEGGALLVNQAPHHTDLMRVFMGDFRSVSATVANIAHPYLTGEDHAVGHVQFVRGGIGSFHYSNIEAPGFYAGITVSDRRGRTVEIQTDARMFVAGAGGMAHIPCINQWTGIDAGTLNEWNAEDAALFNASTEPTMQYHVMAMAEFLNAITEDREPSINGEAGLQTVLFNDGCYLSNAQGGAPVALPLPEMAEGVLCGRDMIIRLCDAA